MSTWTYTCEQHPNLRWTRNKQGGGYIGGGVLIFEGCVETLRRGAPFGMSQARFDSILFSGFLGEEGAKEYAEKFLEHHVPECNCPMSLLRVIAEEYQPVPHRVRYCEECGEEDYKLAPQDHCGKPMLLVAGSVVIEENVTVGNVAR